MLQIQPKSNQVLTTFHESSDTRMTTHSMGISLQNSVEFESKERSERFLIDPPRF